MDRWQKTSLAGIGATLLVFAGFTGTQGYKNSSSTSTSIPVTVVGAVKKPGLLNIASGTDVQTAINLAGGAMPGADLTSIDLTQKLSAKTKVIVGDTTGRISSAPDVSSIETSTPQISTRFSSSGGNAPAAMPGPGSISINSATVQDFERLPKIGPVTALAIVHHRARIGQFTSIEQLDDVKGIGPKTLSLIRPYCKL